MERKVPDNRHEGSPVVARLTKEEQALADKYSPFRDPEPSKNKRRPSDAPDMAARTKCKASAFGCDVAHWRGQVLGGARWTRD